MSLRPRWPQPAPPAPRPAPPAAGLPSLIGCSAQKQVRFDPNMAKETTIKTLCTPIPTFFKSEMNRKKQLPFMLYLNNVLYDRRLVGPNPKKNMITDKVATVSLLAAQKSVQEEAFETWKLVNPQRETWEGDLALENQIVINAETRWVLEYVNYVDPTECDASFERFCMVPEAVAGTVLQRADVCRMLIERLWNPQSMNKSKTQYEGDDVSSPQPKRQCEDDSDKSLSLFTTMQRSDETPHEYYQRSLHEMSSQLVEYREFVLLKLDDIIEKEKKNEQAGRRRPTDWPHEQDYVEDAPLRVVPVL